MKEFIKSELEFKKMLEGLKPKKGVQNVHSKNKEPRGTRKCV